MPVATNMIGRRYGSLVALRRIQPKRGDGHVRWECLCDCGLTTIVRGSLLRSGNTKSCGCLRLVKQIKHGGARRSQRHVLYWTWTSMRSRCNNPNDSSYSNYGAIGVKVCPEWDSFEQFLVDMGERPEGTTLDRIDPNGDYTVSNCRWATAYEQRHNRRKGKYGG